MRISDWSSDVCSSDLARKAAATSGRPMGTERIYAPLNIFETGVTVSIVGRFSWTPPRRCQPFGRLKTDLVPHPVAAIDPVPQLHIRKLSGPAAQDSARGRAACRDRVCQYVSMSAVAVPIKKQTK